MRVGHLGREVELEVGIVVHVCVSKPNQRPAVLCEDSLLEDGLQRRVEHLADVLHQHGVADANGRLEGSQVVRISELDHLERVLLLHRLDPRVGLVLRVDHQRPPLPARHQDAVVDAHVIRWQTPDVPVSHLHRARQRAPQSAVVAHGHVQLLAPLHPLVHELVSVRPGEGAEVRDARRADEDIANKEIRVMPELIRRLFPAHLLVRQTGGELLRAREALDGELRLILEGLLLVHRRLELRLEGGDVVLHSLKLVLLLLELRHRLREGVLGGFERLSLGLDKLSHARVDVHGARPHAQRHRRLGLALDVLRRVIRVVHVLGELLHLLGRDVILVVLEQRGHEVAARQHLLGRVPVRLLSKQDAHRLHGHLHQGRGFWEALHLDDVRLVQRVE